MKKCLFCKDELEQILDEDDVYEGGIIEFRFSFGSTKFDKCVGITKYKAYICDRCAKEYVDLMEETLEE